MVIVETPTFTWLIKELMSDDHIRMLYVYPKGKQESLSRGQLKQLKVIVERW